MSATATAARQRPVSRPGQDNGPALPSALAGGAKAGLAPVPLRVRLLAWWEGASVEEILAALRKDAAEATSAGRAAAPDAEAPAAEPEPEGPRVFWTPERMRIAEMMFGTGEIVPGGTARTLDMIGAFGLGQEVNVLNIGAGLAGAARAIAAKYEGWVTAYEPDPALAQAARDPSRNRTAVKQSGSSLKPIKVKMKLSDKATILHADLETVEIKPGVFDCAFSRDTLFTVADKGRLLAEIFEGLKPFGPLLFTDYVLAEGAAGHPLVRRWIDAEPRAGRPWTSPEVQRALTEIGYDLRVDQDISAQQRGDLIQAYSDFIVAHERGGVPRELARDLLGFSELWAARMAVLEAGLVEVRKFVALRPKNS